jgi:hypothetical protein
MLDLKSHQIERTFGRETLADACKRERGGAEQG